MAKPIREISRKSKKRTTYPVVIIVCEGKKTEPIYFQHFKGRHKPIRIEIAVNAAGKDYHALINEAVRVRNKYIAGTESTYTVWCVSDVDVDYKTSDNQFERNAQLKRYYKEASEHGFRIALSNPCFEIWFLLHFTYTTVQIPNYDALKKILSKYLINYEKNSDAYDLLEGKLEDAMSNAKRLKEYHERQGKVDLVDGTVNPYTNVWELVDSIYD